MSIDTSGLDKRIRQLEKEFPQFLEDAGEQLAYAFHAFIEENFHETASSRPGGKGSKLQVRSGHLTRSFIPGQPDNIFVVQSSGGVLKMQIGSKAVYAKIHDEGGRVYSKGKMVGGLMALYMKTGEKIYLYSALKVKKLGYIDIPARPFLKPASAELEKYAPQLISTSLNRFLQQVFA